MFFQLLEDRNVLSYTTRGTSKLFRAENLLSPIKIQIPYVKQMTLLS